MRPAPGDVRGRAARAIRVGVLAWSFVGAVAALVIVVLALAAVSEIVLPMTFAAVLAVCLKPLVDALVRRRLRPAAAAGLVVLGLLALAFGLAVATVRGVTQQVDRITISFDGAQDEAARGADVLGIDQASLDTARAEAGRVLATVTSGLLPALARGIGTLVAVASGMILGALIMYYLLKDGTQLRRAVVAGFPPTLRDDVDAFIGDTCQVLRSYGRGRSVMSALVAAVIGLVALVLGLPLVVTIAIVNFFGGYVPYIGAFVGGGLAVLVALGERGPTAALVMAVAVLASNLALENLVEPRVMGRTLDVHPLVVLVVTALGGLLGGIVGLILAVPAWVIARHAATLVLRPPAPAGDEEGPRSAGRAGRPLPGDDAGDDLGGAR